MLAKLKNTFLSYSLIFLIFSVTSFTAFNWKLMGNYQKIAIPMVLISVSLICFNFFKDEKYKKLFLFFSCFLIGTLFAVYGQVYQTGADSWILFRNWAIFLVIPILTTIYYPLHLLFIIVNTLMAYFYFSLSYEYSISLFISSLIPAIYILIYPFIIDKIKIKFNDFFYNTLIILFYVFFNISMLFFVFGHFKHTIIPLMIILLIYGVVNKIYQKTIVIPFSILSLGLYFWVIFTSDFYKYIGYSTYTYLIITLIILAITLKCILKTVSLESNSWLIKIAKIIGGYIKLGMFISLLALFFLAIQEYSREFEIVFLIYGILLIFVSLLLPRILDFKNDNIEHMTFLIALLSIGNYFYLLKIDIRIIIVILNILFNLAFIFRRNNFINYLFFPVQYLSISFFVENYIQKFTHITFIFITVAPLFVILFSIFFEDKINLSKNKEKWDRVLFGNIIYPILYPTLSAVSDLTDFSNISFLLKRILLILISVVVINNDYIKSKFLRKEGSEKLEKNNIILSVIFIALQNLSVIYNVQMDYIVFLLLFYIHKNKKILVYILNVYIVSMIFMFYYKNYSLSLLIKSKHMLVSAVILLLAYLILKYFTKGVDKNEK